MKIKAKYPCYLSDLQERVVTRYAWFPKRAYDGRGQYYWIWLCKYISYQSYDAYGGLGWSEYKALLIPFEKEHEPPGEK